MVFFTELQNHSEVKLSILEKYTIPWMRKIILNKYGPKKCLLIDGFAGKGKYDNGKKGSPVIMIEAAVDFYNQAVKSKWDKPEILIYLNEWDIANHQTLISNIENLGFETMDNKLFSSTNYKSISIVVENKTFEDFLTDILKQRKDGYSLIPSFCFVDPFGFSSTPFRLFKNYLENQNSELLINFIYEHTNRFIRHPNEKIKNQISDHMGLVSLDELSEKVADLGSLERKQLIIETYTNNILNETDAVHVRHFDIKKNGKTKMILFYVTKNINGLKLMKETMWKHDETGLYVYNEKKKMVQLDFDTILSQDKQLHIELLSIAIYKNYSGIKRISYEEIEEFTLVETIYPVANFVKPALKILEEKGVVNNFKGRNKAKSYPPKTTMDFS
ncbi:three-Cys-motif partner protein TcmP [Peribacillus frigoritolerans]|uniref:three-Cys-motif partner protein TcmP n=1 Tax=Peribacillus frigoritolerans TaxID=450367 RepID=UPI003D0160CE